MASPAATGDVQTPLNGSQLRQVATLVRTVSQGDDGVYVISGPGTFPTVFSCACLPPKTNQAPATDTMPRAAKNKSTLYYLKRQLGRELPAYDTATRLSIAGWPTGYPIGGTPPVTVYETVGPARAERLGLSTWAWTQDVLPVDWLWPLSASLQELGGAVVASLPVAVWEPSAWRAASRGAYETLDGEAPPEYLAELQVTNRRLVVGSRTFVITSATPQFQQPHVALQLTEVKQ